MGKDVQLPLGSEWPRTIHVTCGAAGKAYDMAVEQDATPAQMIDAIKQAYAQDGVDLQAWQKTEVGGDSPLVLMRKSDGNAIVPPDVSFGQLQVQEGEVFQLVPKPVVAYLD